MKALHLIELDQAAMKALIKSEAEDKPLEFNEYIEAGRIWRREGFDAALAHLRVLKEG